MLNALGFWNKSLNSHNSYTSNIYLTFQFYVNRKGDYKTNTILYRRQHYYSVEIPRYRVVVYYNNVLQFELNYTSKFELYLD